MIEYEDTLRGSFAGLAARAGAAVERALKRAGAQHVRTVARERFGPYTGEGYPDKLQRRGGGLQRSVRADVIGTGLASTLALTAGPPARIQEYGGTVTARRVKYLTIPLRAALTGAGLPKRPGARDWEDAFVLRAKDGRLFIARPKGRKLELLYKLQRSVKIPPRFGFSKHFREHTLPYLREQARLELTKAVKA